MLAREGVRVAVHSRQEARGMAVADRIRAAGGEAVVVLGDVADTAGCANVVDSVNDQLGGVDILVNNVGGGTNTLNHPAFFDIPWSEWLDAFEMNVGSCVRLIHGLVPPMVDAGWGRVVNISSASGAAPFAEESDYAATKAAINNLSVSVSRALAGTGVTVNTVSPGLIVTPPSQQWLTSLGEQGWGDSPEEVERRVTGELLGQSVSSIGRPNDVAGLVALVVSPLGRYITGANLRVDGGMCKHVNG
jgi:NAD(P)-dependent dehydrogenase (short-subunit alcohol dehydrogenase family)